MKKIIKIILTLQLFSVASFAQEMLSIDDAIKMGLEKNYSVLISKNDKLIAGTQNNLGAAGMSPTVSLNGNLNLSNVNSHQEFATGTIQDKTGAASNIAGASLNLNWTIFDGLRMFAIKKRLNETEQLSALQLKMQMENTIYNIILGYYDIVRINTLIKAAQQNLSIYEERIKVAKMKLEIGSDSKVDLLLTRSDENKAKSDILRLEQQLLNAKVNLNTLMARSADVDFKTSDTIAVNYSPSIDELKKTVVKSNSSILISLQNELITSQTIIEARSFILPQVQLNGAYNFTRNQSQAGIVLLNQQLGLNGGLSASWLIFNGNRNNKLIQERQIRLQSQKFFTEQTKQQIDALVFINYQSFLSNKKILDLERENLDDSKEVLNISLERYKIGKANLLETIETQKNLEDAQSRYINALYETKKAETELLKANGGLIK